MDPPSGEPPLLKKRWTPRIGQSDLPIPKPTKLVPPSSLAVTDFRIYLECPYRFYLRKIERLYEVDDADTELQANQFGNLIHDCLASLHPSPVETSRDSEAIADFLDDKLDALVETRYGVHLRPAVQLQVEQAKQRLRAFAVVQAARAQEGWTIFATEHSFEQEHPIAISFEGRTMLVHGRVDRIDYHPRLRKWAVWDYKTSDTAKNPVKAHYTRGRGWTDFQLLLYREMIRSISQVQPTDAVMVGYIQLPKNASQTKFEEAEFAAEQLETGMRSALDASERDSKRAFLGT